jgi:2-keto-3-deoxy-6-phosphogluconate aldolase
MSGIETAREINLAPKLGSENTKTTTMISTGIPTSELPRKETKMKTTIPDVVRQFLSDIGRKGGCVSTDKKVEAARANGVKGGRPRKMEICAAT